MSTMPLKKIYEEAFNKEATFGSCAQAVLATLAEHFDFISPELVQQSYYLAGGGARGTGGTCGALAGGLLAIGAKYGRTLSEFGKEKTAAHEKGFNLAAALSDRFIQEYGAVSCAKVQEKYFGRSFYLRDEEEFAAFEAAGAHQDKCPNVTGNVAKWTAALLLTGRTEA